MNNGKCHIEYSIICGCANWTLKKKLLKRMVTFEVYSLPTQQAEVKGKLTKGFANGKHRNLVHQLVQMKDVAVFWSYTEEQHV